MERRLALHLNHDQGIALVSWNEETGKIIASDQGYIGRTAVLVNGSMGTEHLELCLKCEGSGIRCFEVGPASTQWREELCGCSADPQHWPLLDSGKVTWK